MKVKTKHISILFIVCVICLVAAGPSWSGTYYVDIVNGDNQAPGDAPSGAWKTLHYAVTQLQAGDTLNVATGTYNLDNGEPNAALPVTKDNITIQGTTGTVLDGHSVCSNWRPAFNINASGVTIRNLEIMGFSCDLSVAGIRVGSGSNNRIESCKVSSSDWGIVFEVDSGSGNSVIDSFIHNNDHGVIVSGASPEIRRNSIYENRSAIEVTNNSGTIRPKIINNLIYGYVNMLYGIGITAFGTGTTVAAEIYHNTIYGCAEYGIYISQDFPVPTEKIQVKFNIVSDSFTGVGVLGQTSGILDFAYNNIFGNDTSYSGVSPGANDVAVDPKFVNTLSYDFHLQATSTIIDYIDGVVGDPVVIDRDGNVRPIGTGKEPGCYEFSAASEPIVLPIIKAGKSLGDFGMISIVHWPDNPDAQAVFNIKYDPRKYRIGTWDPEQGKYIEFGQGLTMEPGSSYWILSRDDLVVNFKGVPVSMIEYMEVCLYTHPSTGVGWNMIAPPNAANYLWNDVLVGRWLGEDDPLNVDPVSVSNPVASTLINHRLWEWQSGEYKDHRLDENFVLEYNKGYWVKAIVEGAYLVFPEYAQVAGLSTPRNTMMAWKGKAFQWLKAMMPKTREAIADNDRPPTPMKTFDDSVNPLFEGCFIESANAFR